MAETIEEPASGLLALTSDSLAHVLQLLPPADLCRFTLLRSSPRGFHTGARDGLCRQPGGDPGANLKTISHMCHLILVAFVWELAEETIDLPLGCLQGGEGSRFEIRVSLRMLCSLAILSRFLFQPAQPRRGFTPTPIPDRHSATYSLEEDGRLDSCFVV